MRTKTKITQSYSREGRIVLNRGGDLELFFETGASILRKAGYYARFP